MLKINIVSLAVAFILLSSSSFAAVTRLGSPAGFTETTGTTANFSYTTTAGTNTILVVGCGWGGTETLNSLTFNGVNFTAIETPQITNGGSVTLAYLKNPSVGTFNIVPTFSASTSFNCGAAQFEGVNQATPVSGVTGAGDFTTTPTVNVPCGTGDRVVDSVVGSTALTVDGSQTEEWNDFDITFPIAGSSEACGSSPVTMSWSQSDNWWRIKAMNLEAAEGVSTKGLSMLLFGVAR